VLGHYPQARGARAVRDWSRSGGLSGARVWQLATELGNACLRAWPAGTIAPARLSWIHTNLARIAQAGCRIVPHVWRTRDGTTVVPWAGRLWELLSWLDGSADFGSPPTETRLIAALQTVARFHGAARDAAPECCELGPSPSLAARRTLFQELDGGLADRLAQCVRAGAPPPLQSRAERMIRHYRRCAPGVRRQVDVAQTIRAARQICHGDLWHAHLLWRADQVVGLMDFGAMKIDSPALDIARLLGSLVPLSDEGWRIGVASYAQIQPLAESDRALIPVLDQSGVLLAGISWLKWLLLEQRPFGDWDRVLPRIDAILARLEAFD